MYLMCYNHYNALMSFRLHDLVGVDERVRRPILVLLSSCLWKYLARNICTALEFNSPATDWYDTPNELANFLGEISWFTK